MDEDSAEFISTLNISAFKIASADMTNLSLIKKCALYNKPIIISTELSTLSQINETVSLLNQEGCKNFALLKKDIKLY